MGTGAFTFTPQRTGSVEISATAVDDEGGWASSTITITVNAAPEVIEIPAPLLTVTPSSPYMTIGEEIEFEIEASCAATGIASTVMTINGNDVPIVNGKAVFTPPSAGTYTVVVKTVANSGGSRTVTYIFETFEPSVINIEMTFPLNVFVGDTAEIIITADGEVNISATLDGNPVNVSNGRIAFIAEKVGLYVVEVTVSDNFDNSVISRGYYNLGRRNKYFHNP